MMVWLEFIKLHDNIRFLEVPEKIEHTKALGIIQSLYLLSLNVQSQGTAVTIGTHRRNLSSHTLRWTAQTSGGYFFGIYGGD